MEKTNHKWELRQGAKVLFIIYIFFSSSLAQSQTLKPTNNKGGYTFEIKTSTSEKPNAIKIYGKAYSLKNNDTLSDAKITFACTTISTNTNGEFEFTVKNNDLKTNFLKIIAVGFKTIETEFFCINPDQLIEINFILEEDDKPFLNCAEN